MWAALIPAGVSLLNGFLGSKSAHAQQKNAKAGLDWTKQVYKDAQGNFAPYLAAGTGGLNGLNALAGGDYSGFANSPDYLYAREQAQYGNDHSAAAHGQLYDPGTQLELAHQMNGIASQNLGNYRNSLQYLSTLGMQGASNLGSIGNGLAGNVQAGYNNIGNAQASGYGAIGGALTGIGGAFGNYFAGQQPSLTQSSYGNADNNYGFGGVPPYQDQNYGFGGWGG